MRRYANPIAEAEDINSFRFGNKGSLADTLIALIACAPVPEVPWMLVGGLALGYYIKPRATQDIDILLRDDASLPILFEHCKPLFKRTREHALVHKKTGVEIDVLTPSYIRLPTDIIDKLFEQSFIKHIGRRTFLLISDIGLVLLKLHSGRDQDLVDAKQLIERQL